MSVYTETSTVLDAIKNYFLAQEQYLIDGSAQPDARLLYLHLGIEELLTFSSTQSQRGAGYEIGSAQEVISVSTAVTRELDMAIQRKSVLFTNHQSDLGKESQFYEQASYYPLGILKGNPTNGSQN